MLAECGGKMSINFVKAGKWVKWFDEHKAIALVFK